ncbi:MAG: putative metalloprotease CJM1_0395 family protein [Pseudomonadota bacterium]
MVSPVAFLSTTFTPAHGAVNMLAVAGNPHDTRTQAPPTGEKSKRPNEPTPEDIAQIEKLAATDREVHAHEMAHLAAAGPYARGGPSFTYQTGPDGKRYAVGGEVNIDTSADPHDPHATLTKARAIQAAATAPANPSGQDRAVAAAAAQMAAQAQQEIAAKRNSSASVAMPHRQSQKNKPLGNTIDVYA